MFEWKEEPHQLFPKLSSHYIITRYFKRTAALERYLGYRPWRLCSLLDLSTLLSSCLMLRIRQEASGVALAEKGSQTTEKM